jgi:hypothetical protein
MHHPGDGGKRAAERGEKSVEMTYFAAPQGKSII